MNSSKHFCTKSAIDYLRIFSGGSINTKLSPDCVGLHIITIRNPSKMNAFSGLMMCELNDALHDIASKNESKAVLLRGCENNFCAGGDLSVLTKLMDKKSGEMFSRVTHDNYLTLRRLKIPSFSFIEGMALGAGAELAVSTDLRFIHRSAKIGYIQSSLGLTPGFGAGMRLVELVGKEVAMDMLLNSKVLSAEESVAIGLTTEIVDSEGEVVEKIRKAISETDIELIRSIKELTSIPGNGCSVENCLEIERDIFLRHWGSESHKRKTRAILDGINKQNDK